MLPGVDAWQMLITQNSCQSHCPAIRPLKNFGSDVEGAGGTGVGMQVVRETGEAAETRTSRTGDNLTAHRSCRNRSINNKAQERSLLPELRV